MKVYLAASYSRRLEMVERAADLERLGHRVVSSWIDGHHETNSAHGSQADGVADAAEQETWAIEDVADLIEADAVVMFSEAPHAGNRKRGGRHVELGFALGWTMACRMNGLGSDMRAFVVGPVENVFHCLGAVERYDTWEQCVAALDAPAN